MLKHRLTEIRANDCQAPEKEELAVLLEQMQDCIGSPDPELRDDLIYHLLSRWIPGGVLNHEQMRAMLITALGERGLFYRIGETGDSSVFTRTFSALLVALVIYAHRQCPFLPPGDLRHISERVLAYIAQERDRRGYVDGPGWAHAAAHTADVLDELAQCAELAQSDLVLLLSGLAGLMAEQETDYVHEEDERISVALVSVYRRGLLTTQQWDSWLEGLVVQAAGVTAFPARLRARLNLKNALRAFYFRLLRLDQSRRSTGDLLAAVDTAQAGLLKF